MPATGATSFSHEQQDQNQKANPDTSSSSTAHVEPQTFQATTAVLDTNELLHLIISAIPREHRTVLRIVSKNWQAAVLRVGHVLEPIYHYWSLCDLDVENDNYGLGPVYALEDELALNPVIDCISRTYDDGVEPDYESSYLVTFIKDFSLAELAGRKQEFITDPPLSQLLIASGRFEGGGTQVAVLCERGGIRIGDLLEYFGRLNDVAATYKSASFAVHYCLNESDWEIDEDDLGEAVGGDEGGDGDGEVRILVTKKKNGRA
jgi:hypothetical protein